MLWHRYLWVPGLGLGLGLLVRLPGSVFWLLGVEWLEVLVLLGPSSVTNVFFKWHGLV